MDRRYQGAGPASPPPVRPQACQCRPAVQNASRARTFRTGPRPACRCTGGKGMVSRPDRDRQHKSTLGRIMQAVIGGCRSCPFPCPRPGKRRPPQKPAESSWTMHPSWRSSSATRSIAAPTGALNCGFRAPASGAGFGETCRLEDFDWSAAITLERRLLNGDGVPNAVQGPRGDLASVLADAPPATSPTHILDAPAARGRDAIAGPAWQPPEETWGGTGQEDGGSQVSGCRSRLTSPRPSSGVSVCRPAVQNASRARTFRTGPRPACRCTGGKGMVSRRTVTDNIKAPWAASCKPS